MTKLDDLQRLEFINLVESVYKGVVTKQDLQASKLIEVLFSKPFDLDNSRDIGILISDLEYTVDNTLKPELYDYVTEGIKQITTLGVTQSVTNTLNILGDSAFDFLSLSDRLALDYVSRVGIDGLRLSDRVWGLSDKQAITKEVYQAIRDGDSKYGLAEKIEKVIGDGVPKSSIKRVANTELSRAYSHAKADILKAEQELLPNAEAYVEVSLSPTHRIFDICDYMKGTYRLGDAPLPAYHPNCMCRTRMFMKVSGTMGRITTLDKSLHSYKSETDNPIKQIETIDKIVQI